LKSSAALLAESVSGVDAKPGGNFDVDEAFLFAFWIWLRPMRELVGDAGVALAEDETSGSCEKPGGSAGALSLGFFLPI